MKIALSLMSVLAGVGAAAVCAVLYAACQVADSELVGKIGFVFVLLAPAAAMLVVMGLQAKIGATWLAAPLILLVAAVAYGGTGFLAEWAARSLASKSTTREFWAIYWVGGFAFTASYLFQCRYL